MKRDRASLFVRLCLSLRVHVYADTSRDTFQLPVSSPEDRTDNIQPGLLTNSIHSPSSPKFHEHDNSSFMLCARLYGCISIYMYTERRVYKCPRGFVCRGSVSSTRFFLHLYFHLIDFKKKKKEKKNTENRPGGIIITSIIEMRFYVSKYLAD